MKNTCSQLDTAVKPCPGCERVLPLDEYGKNSHTKSGLMSRCKDCRNAKQREYWARTSERRNEVQRQWQSNNREALLASKKKHYDANRESAIAYQREYAREHPEKRAAIRAARRQSMSAEVLLVTERELRRIKSSPCAACGVADRIEVDHVVPLARGGRHAVGNLQPLCKSCNSSKGKSLLVEWRARVVPFRKV